MLPPQMTAIAIQLCAAGFGSSGLPDPARYPIVVRTGAVLTAQPDTLPDAAATVRDLLALGADFDAGPLAINGRDFATYGVTETSVFDPCALTRTEERISLRRGSGGATVSTVSAVLREAFGARITDTIRPMNASYGARYSWHKSGQAIDFVPAGGVGAVDRERVRALMAAHGFRVIELLGPGDRGHNDHWHVAFARPGQVFAGGRTREAEEDWIVSGGGTEVARTAVSGWPDRAAEPATGRSEPTPPAWDVFAGARWRAQHGGAS